MVDGLRVDAVDTSPFLSIFDLGMEVRIRAVEVVACEGLRNRSNGWDRQSQRSMGDHFRSSQKAKSLDASVLVEVAEAHGVAALAIQEEVVRLVVPFVSEH
jgi:hypothetical protein